MPSGVRQQSALDVWGEPATQEWIDPGGTTVTEVVNRCGHYATRTVDDTPRSIVWSPNATPATHQFPACPHPDCRGLVPIKDDVPGGEYRCICHGRRFKVFRQVIAERTLIRLELTHPLLEQNMGAKTAAKPKPHANGKPSPPAVRASAPAAPLTDQSEVIGSLALTDIAPCPFNVRRHFNEADIAGLADSVRRIGLKERLLVRPVPVAGERPKFAGGKWSGVDHFELVDGERRYRALKLVNKSHVVESVPVVIRNLTDDEVRAIMLASREQSRDLSVSELVAGYSELRANFPDDASLAALVGCTVGHVRSILRLAKLPAWALAAVDAGVLPRATAEVVSRVPGERSRALAACCVLMGSISPDGWTDTCLKDDYWKLDVATGFAGREPLSSRDTKSLIANHFQKQLKGSPFSRKELYVMPGCEPGHERSIQSCDECPKLAANDPEAVAEGTRGDVCLDPDCYAMKVEAYREKEIAKAASKGIVEADVELHAGTRPPRGWCFLSDPLAHCELNHSPGAVPKKLEQTPLKELLKDTDCPLALAFTSAGKPVILAKTADVRKALIDLKYLPKPEKRERQSQAERTAAATARAGGNAPKKVGPSPWDVDREAAEIASKVLRDYTTEQCSGLDEHEDAHEDGPIRGALELTCRAVCYEWSRSREGEQLLREWVVPDGDFDKGLDAAICAMKPSQMIGLMTAVAAWWELNDGPNRPTGESLLAFAELDWPALQEKARRILTGDESAEEKVAKAEAAQSAAAAIVHCAKCKATFDATGKSRCPSCGAEVPKAKAADHDSLRTNSATAAPPAVVLLSEIDGFPDAAFDTCLKAGITSVGTLLEHMASEQPQCLELPLRNRLVTFFVGKLDLKMKAAENAADAVAAKVAETSPPEPGTAAETSPPAGTPFSSVPEFPAEVASILHFRHNVGTLEQLQAKQAEYAKQPGRAGISLYGVLRELNCPEKLVYPAGDALTDFLNDQIDAKEKDAQAAQPAAKAKRK